MTTRADSADRLRKIADETMTIISSGGYQTTAGANVRLAEKIALAVAGTHLYLPGDPLPAGAERIVGTPRIEVTAETTLAAAQRLGDDVACLVFASAKNPGGGFRGGALAQEEDLARASALYACQVMVPQFYDFHRWQRDLCYSDRVIYSPGVPVFRDEDGTLLEEPYEAAFLTAAAPNLGAMRARQPQSAQRVPAILRTRAARILDIAAAHDHRALVLGAWGCGVFGNDPAVVAGTFADLVYGDGRFDRIVFAVFDRLGGSPVRSAFARQLLPAPRSG